jgi:hypothetical protein
MYSIIASEWPECRQRLEERLARVLERRGSSTGQLP